MKCQSYGEPLTPCPANQENFTHPDRQRPVAETPDRAHNPQIGNTRVRRGEAECDFPFASRTPIAGVFGFQGHCGDGGKSAIRIPIRLPQSRAYGNLEYKCPGRNREDQKLRFGESDWYSLRPRIFPRFHGFSALPRKLGFQTDLLCGSRLFRLCPGGVENLRRNRSEAGVSP